MMSLRLAHSEKVTGLTHAKILTISPIMKLCRPKSQVTIPLIGHCALWLLACLWCGRAPAQDDEFALDRFSTSEWLVEIDYVMWWTSGSDVPPLVTTSPATTPRPQAGVLGNSGTVVLAGGEKIDDGDRSGGRFALTRNLDAAGDVSFFFNGAYANDDVQSGNFTVSSTGIPILARPFIDAVTQQQDSELVAFPAVLVGTIAVENTSEMIGGEIGVNKTLFRAPRGTAFLNCGYRYLRFSDAITIREDLRSIELGGAVVLNTEFLVQDSFEAANNFHGGNIGVGFRRSNGTWTTAVKTSVAMGSLSRRMTVSGKTDVSVPTLPTTTTAGGLLTQPTNIGSYTSDSFVAIPELNLKVSRVLSDRVSVDVGYTFILLPLLWRSAEQIDPVVNQSLIGGGTLSGPVNPAFTPRRSDTWVQGLSAGLTGTW